MKHLLLCFIALAASNMSFGQLTGPKYIPGTGGINDYPTIAMAIADLNLKGVGSGGVTFNVAAGYAEFITAPLQVTATGTMLNPIIFHKNPITVGPNPMVSAGYPGTATPASPFQDGIWALIGSDYVTIDGIDLNDPNTANPMSMEYGYGLFKKSDADGCQFNIIRNCMVTLWRGNNVAGSGPAVDGSRAINVVNSMITGQTTALTINNPAGSNSNNGFYSNTLQNCNIGIALIGYVAPAPFLFADQNNDIGGMSPNTGNNIINYGGAVAAGRPAAGVRTQNQYGLNVSYNTINNNNGSGVNHPSTLRGIYLQEAISASATISHNTLTITGGSTTSQISVIENVSGSTAAGNTININNNTIVNCTWPTATTGIFYGIWNGSSAFTVNIFGNVLSNISSPSSGLCYLIHGGSPVNLNMYNNEIGNVIKTLSGTLYGLFAGTTNLSVHDNNVHHLTTMGGGNAIYGFYDVSSPVNETYYNNHFYNFTNNGTGGVFGIYTNTAAGARNIYGNTINTFAANGGGPIYGIYGAKSSQTIYKNRIYDLMSGSANGIVYGIYLVSGDAVNIYNNYISDLRTPAAQNNNVLSGIFLSITTAINLNVYYNTIYLEGTSTGNLFSSAALYVNTIPILDLQDNILINNCQPTGLGTASAFRRNNTNLATYALSSDYNNYFVPGLVPNQFIFYDGTTGYATLPAYKFLVGPVRDVSSFTENSPFVNAALNDFHINTTLPTLCESGGIRVISPISVTTDYDNDLRWGEPGYVGTGTAPDVGADEFDGFNPLACNPPPNVTILMLSPFSAMISWIPPTPPPSVGYEYEVRTYGMPGSGPDGLFTSGGTSEMNIVVPGLAGGTTYSFYIRSNCGNGIFSPWSAAYPFTTPMETIITGSLTDSLGVSPPPATVYIVAHTACNPDDTLSTLNGGIAYTLGPGNVGTYTVHCNNFLDPPDPGEQVYISFFNTSNLDFNPAIVEMSMMPITYCHIIVTPVRHVNLPYRTSFTWVWMPPHSSLKIHYTHVVGCGNTDVFEWVPGSGYVKIRQWNWNHYCTWRYLTNNTNVGKCIKIHNDNGNINFDMQLTYLIVPLSPSNYNLFALFNMGWRNRPYPSCEFGNIVAPSHTYVDFEGASLTNFPSRLGQDGVQNLTIQFQSYDNIFWNDMNMMIDLVNITQPGTLELYIPDATIPLTSAVINPGDTACFFNPGGILAPGTHTMTLSASGGLSIGIDALNYTTSMPVPAIPTVATTPVTNITYHSAVSGGTVTNDGGAAVTARGVCWSTTPNPTLLDSYTTDGSGLGTFTSLATPLLPSTQYYLRAYATNLAGTGYGMNSCS